MKKINQQQLIDAVCDAVIKANTTLSPDIKAAITNRSRTETSPRGKIVFQQIADNQKLAEMTKLPLCQDTGICILDVTIGNQVQIDFDLTSALNQGIRDGYEQGHLRCSVVADPLRRINTMDNTPGIIHYHYTVGDNLKITVAPKGAGSENMSQLKMFNPSVEKSDIIDYVVDCVLNAGGKPCPPIIVGVGIGGTFEQAALNSKRAAISNLDFSNPDPLYQELEETIFQKLNQSNIGPLGLGGNSTCLGVRIIPDCCHIASLPVAVNIQCHVARHQEVIL